MPDDDAECEQQVLEMNLVYRGAVLTIVNSAAQDAKGAGRSPTQEPRICSIEVYKWDDSSISTRVIDRAMAISVWKTRSVDFPGRILDLSPLDLHGVASLL